MILMQILNKLRECEQRIAVTSDGVWNLQCWNFRITTCIVLIWNVLLLSSGPRQLSRYSDWLRAGRSGDRIPVAARFSAPVQTDPGVHPASCTMGTGSFPGVERCRGVTLTPHPFIVSWSSKSRAIPLRTQWAVRPVQSLSACTRVQFTFTLTFIEPAEF